MKILILTCNTGQGHNSTANSVKEAFSHRGIYCESVDAIAFVSSKMSAFIGNMHTKLYRYAPVLFDRGYELCEKYPSIFANDSVTYGFFALGVKKLSAFVTENGFTGIIAVHPFTALMATELKKALPHLKCAFVATDYTCAPGVSESVVDAYFIPHANLIGEFIACGVPKERIIPSGIPVKSVFYSRKDKLEARREIGLPENCRHLLMMCGSMGCGPMADITERLSAIMPDDVYLTVVCGTNARIKKRIEKFARSNVNVVGFVDNVSTLMDSADLYVTKAGGLSTTEAAIKRLPLFFIDAVSGCESYNRYFFLTRAMALASNDKSALPSLIIDALNDSTMLQMQSRTMENEFNYDSAEIICSYFTK